MKEEKNPLEGILDGMFDDQFYKELSGKGFIQSARDFATDAHEGQTRKYTGEPYITHPIAVMDIVNEVTDDPNILAAALLHDVVEDCGVGLGEIGFLFGDKVADLVFELTDVSKPEDGNRKARKEIDRQHLAAASPEAQTIKLADLIHNTQSVVEHDTAFAKVYMAEKALLLEVLYKGDPQLYDRATRMVEDYHKAAV